ncbi:phosphatase PAP2 family protein [Sneathiella sp.]|uniref:phosphatase PAP2 family protein n=1 Tax=Sneathiella sp. TaxID=1964365 RepID=UPI00260E57B8|nr:phosphatase PAP2 family protein [Sneathiella sp.]MDF2367975.1 phosphatase PAP2 family protein [Sneathiella sp.]
MKSKKQDPCYDLNIGRQLIYSALLLVIVLIVFEATHLDFYLSNYFFDGKAWVINANEPTLRFLFYNLPRWLLIAYASSVLLLFILSFILKAFAKFRTRKQLFIILCAILVPLTVGVGKKITNVYCPYQLEEYGGTKPYVHPFQDSHLGNGGKCFPAGHASAGFALLLFIPLVRSKKQKLLALAGALTAGWVMGGYQMLNGRHFLSHTIVTMLLSWIIVCILYFLIFKWRLRKE